MRLRLFGALALSTLLVGCPRTPDDTGSTDTGSHDTGSTDTSTTDTGTTDTGTTDTSTDTGTTDTGTTGTDCYTLPSGLPPFGGSIDPSLITNTPYDSVATGLADLVTAATNATPDDGTVVALDTPIDVSGAYVTSTGYIPSAATYEVNFWLADKNSAIYVRLSGAGYDVKAGDQVDFTASAVANYNGTPQVSTITSLTVTSYNNDVYVRESTGATLTSDDFFWVHHIYGEIISDGTACGGSNYCFGFRHGGPSGPVETFRSYNGSNPTSAPIWVNGDCVEIYAPLDQYHDAPQLNMQNSPSQSSELAWTRWFGNANGR